MARLFNKAAGDNLRSGAAVRTAVPFTMGIWARSGDGADNFQTLMAIGQDTVDENFRMRARLTSVKVEVEADGAAGTGSADTTVGMTAGVWHHIMGVYASTTSRSAFLDGANKVTNTSLAVPAGLNTTWIGELDDGSPSDRFSGDLARAAFWDVALVDQNVATVANGWSPRQVAIDNLIAYYPVNGQATEPNIVGTGFNMTVAGTTVSEEPPVPKFMVAG